VSEVPRTLDTSVLSAEATQFQDFLLSRIIGQERAIRQFIRVYQNAQVGLNKPNRPLGVFLFTGPTGTGKTQLIKTAAEFVLNSQDAVTRIDCSEYQHSHEVAKLIGSPPGYVGHADKSTIRLSQDKLDRWQTPKHKINFLLFDEIEEAHDTLLAAILQILDAGRLTLGTGEVTDFSKTIVILTSNLGERDAQKAMSGATLGLRPEPKVNETTDEQVYKVSKAAAVKHFRAKFMNRVDRIIVFRSLSEESLRKILKIEVTALQDRVWAAPSKKWEAGGCQGVFPQFRPIFRLTEAAQAFLIKEGTSVIYGARELNRAIDRFMTFPIGALMSSGQIEHGDVVEVDHEEGKSELTFRVIEHRDLTPILPTYDGTPPPQIRNPEDGYKNEYCSEFPKLPGPPVKYIDEPPLPPKPKRRPWGKI
jgi:ATP-dependent Clp protease ATP-binding subunit ClpB